MLVQYCAVTLEYHLCKFTSFSMYKYVGVFLYLYISYACACVFVCVRDRSGENNCVHGDNHTYSVYIYTGMFIFATVNKCIFKYDL